MSAKTYVTYELWDGCKAPQNLEYNNHLAGIRCFSFKFDRDSLLELADSLDEWTGNPIGKNDRRYIANKIRMACGVMPL